jgi:hypothetical protein
MTANLAGRCGLARKLSTYSDMINEDKSQIRAPLHANVAKTLIAINTAANEGTRTVNG